MTGAPWLCTLRGQFWWTFCLGVVWIGFGVEARAVAQDPFGFPFGNNNQQTGTSGLQGLLPVGPPSGLQKADYQDENLGDRWKSLAEMIATDISAFYEKQPESVSAQRELLQTWKRHAAQLLEAARTETDPRQSTLLRFLSAQLKIKAELYEEVLKMLERVASQSPVLAARMQLDNLQSHLSDQTNSERNTGDGWTKYLLLDELDQSLNPKPADDAKKGSISAAVSSRAAVEATRERLRLSPSHSEAVRKTLSSEPFVALANSLENLLVEWDTATATQNDAITRYEKLRDVLSRPNPDVEFDLIGFIPTVSNYEKRRIERDVTGQLATDILNEFQVVAKIAGDAADSLGRWLRRTYFNYDTHASVFEGDLQSLADRRDRQIEPVQEVVQGAKVSGHSDTTTMTTVDVVRNDSVAEIHLLVDGITNSQTIGERCQIRVRNAGRADFEAMKPIYITPDGFRTAPSVAGARAGNMPYDPQTPISCLPVFGTALENFALKSAQKQIPNANAMTRQRVVSRLQERLDEEVGNGLAEGERTLREGQLARLEKYDLHPKAAEYRSTDTLVFLTNRITRADEFGGSELPVEFIEPTGITIHAHESALTAFLDRASLENRILDEKGLRAEFERYLSDLFGQDLNFAAPQTTGPKREGRFKFFDRDNMRIIVENGLVNFTVQTKFVETQYYIPPQLIAIPFGVELEGEKTLLRRGTAQEMIAKDLPKLEGELTEEEKAKDAPPAASGGIRLEFERMIDERIEMPRYIELKMQEKPVRYFVRRIIAVNGWVSIWLVPEDEAAAIIASEANQEIPLPEAPKVEVAPLPVP